MSVEFGLIMLPESKDSQLSNRITHHIIMDEVSNNPEELEDVAEKSGSAGLVFLTILVLALIGALAALPEFIGKTDAVKNALEKPAWWTENIGEYHSLILKLPIGIIFLTLVMEVCSWLSFGKYRPMTAVGLFLAIITGTLACVTGYVEMMIGGNTGDVWNNHMWGGIGFVGILGLAFLAKLWGRRNGSKGPIYGILLFGAAGVMGWAAHIAGEKYHGKDPVTNTLLGLKLIKAAGEDGADGEGGVDGPPPASEPKDRLAYAHVVMSIVKSKCLMCHSKDDKKKGDLLMDTYADLIAGGASQDGDEYRTLTPGDAKKSYLITVINLPLDDEDDMHMPPAKKTQLEAHEIELLTWWVNSIPASDTLEDKTLAEMDAPENIIAAAAMLITPEELQAAEEAKAAAEAKIEADKTAKREVLQTSLDELKKDEVFKTSLNYASQDSTDLEFTAVSLRKDLNDEAFSKLAAVAESLISVKLGSTSVSEGALASELPKMKNLKKLDLGNTEVGDGVLDAVAQLENLEWLNLYGTKVTDAGLQKLKGLGNLKKIYLWNSQATPDGAEALAKELPGLTAVFGSDEGAKEEVVKAPEPAPEAPKPAEPAPEAPKPAEPVPEAPKPAEPAPEAPKPAEPAEPAPEAPKPAEPAPEAPAPPA